MQLSWRTRNPKTLKKPSLQRLQDAGLNLKSPVEAREVGVVQHFSVTRDQNGLDACEHAQQKRMPTQRNGRTIPSWCNLLKATLHGASMDCSVTGTTTMQCRRSRFKHREKTIPTAAVLGLPRHNASSNKGVFGTDLYEVNCSNYPDS